MTVVTVFRSRLRPDVEEAYRVVADEMSRLVSAMPGFIDERFYFSDDGERVTVVRFADLDRQRAWAEHPLHRVAQRRGRDEFYAWYDISVSEETYQRQFTSPSAEATGHD